MHKTILIEEITIENVTEKIDEKVQEMEKDGYQIKTMSFWGCCSTSRIIKGLRNKVAILDKNGYHSIVNGHGFIHACWAMADQTFSGYRSAVFMLQSL